MIELKKDFTDRELLWFGPVMALFVGIVGFILIRRFDLVNAARGLWAVAAILIAVYYAIPALRLPMYRTWMYALFPIGWTVAHIMLAIMFYGVLTPIGLVMRAVRYDPMQRRIDPNAETYWTDRDSTVDPQRYFRQY